MDQRIDKIMSYNDCIKGNRSLLLRLPFALFFCVLLFSTSLGKAQNKDIESVKKDLIHLEHSDLLRYDESLAPGVQILIGNIRFRHDSAYMYCDSAHFYPKSNSFEAFKGVRMEQGDTLFVFAHFLRYDGEHKKAFLRENVKMENRDVTLFTDSLDYDRIENIGYYFEGGMLLDSLNELTSINGSYRPNTKIATFSDQVRLVNPDFELTSDTLLYDTRFRIATILGNSVIKSDSGTIYTKRGIHDTNNNLSYLLDRSRVVTDGHSLTGDSLFYDSKQGIGEAFNDVFLSDSVNHVGLTGNYCYYNKTTNYSMATDSTCFLEFSEQDTLFLHADTLKMIQPDSLNKEISAYWNVRFYRKDIQGKCDSMSYNLVDSTLVLYRDPVIWNENHQLFGDTISMFLKNGEVDYVYIRPSVFLAEELKNKHYNQLSGNKLKAFFEKGDMRRADIDQNVETIYYREEQNELLEMNYTKSSSLTLFLKDKKMEKTIWRTKPECTLKPLEILTEEEQKLKKFKWFIDLRPKNKYDIFRRVSIKEQESESDDSKQKEVPETTAVLSEKNINSK